MRSVGAHLWVEVACAVYFIAFLAAPVFPYGTSVSVPGAYATGYAACFPGGFPVPASQATAEEASCLESYQLPPSGIVSYATPAYRLFGYGRAPYSAEETVTSGNHTALLYFSHGALQAAEEFDSPHVEYNPPQIVEIDEAPVSSSDFGFVNITIVTRNVGFEPVTDPTVYLSMEGYSSNSTAGGLTWVAPRIVGGCPSSWLPSDFCTVTQVVPNMLPVNKSFSYYVEIRGTSNGSPFVYRQGFGEAYPAGGVGSIWVGRFLAAVNQGRGNHQLVENTTLDAFAALRFRTASANYSISDYGLAANASSFFGQYPSWHSVDELLLFPARETPTSFASFLAAHAPGHWAALEDTNYTWFGYYVGHAPYLDVELPCPIYEILGTNVNITQYFQGFGCQTILAGGTTWLVVILGS